MCACVWCKCFHVLSYGCHLRLAIYQLETHHTSSPNRPVKKSLQHVSMYNVHIYISLVYIVYPYTSFLKHRCKIICIVALLDSKPSCISDSSENSFDSISYFITIKPYISVFTLSSVLCCFTFTTWKTVHWYTESMNLLKGKKDADKCRNWWKMTWKM